MEPAGFQGVAGDVAGAAVIGQEIAELEMQMRRRKGGGADARQQGARLDTTADFGKGRPFGDDMPVEAIGAAAIRELMGEDDDAALGIPAKGVRIGDEAMGDGENRRADSVLAEAHIDADMQPAETGAVDAEIVVAQRERLQGIQQGIDRVAGRRLLLRPGGGASEEQQQQREGEQEARHRARESSKKAQRSQAMPSLSRSRRAL